MLGLVHEKDFRPFYGSLLFISVTELFASVTLASFSYCLALAGFLLLIISLSVPFAIGATARGCNSVWLRGYRKIAVPCSVLWQGMALSILFIFVLGYFFRWQDITSFVGACGLFILSTVLGIVGGLRLKSVNTTATFPDLPLAFDGLVVAILSDIHAGAIGSNGWLLSRINYSLVNAKPDLVLVVGDLVDHDWMLARKVAETVLNNVQTFFGAFGVLGNHDVYASSKKLCGSLECSGLKMLRNESVKISRASGSIYIVGIDDPTSAMARGMESNLEEALENIPTEAFKVLISHRPEGFDWAESFGVHLVVAGHTHGGTMNAVSGISRYRPGLTSRSGRHLFLSAGVGSFGVNRRWRCPKIGFITLKRKEENNN